jgi:hypothetical protein
MLRRVALVKNLAPPPKRRLQEPRGLTSKTTSFFIVTAVKTSNLNIVLLYGEATHRHTATRNAADQEDQATVYPSFPPWMQGP